MVLGLTRIWGVLNNLYVHTTCVLTCSFLSSVAVLWTTFFFLRAVPFPPIRDPSPCCCFILSNLAWFIGILYYCIRLSVYQLYDYGDGCVERNSWLSQNPVMIVTLKWVTSLDCARDRERYIAIPQTIWNIFRVALETIPMNEPRVIDAGDALPANKHLYKTGEQHPILILNNMPLIVMPPPLCI